MRPEPDVGEIVVVDGLHAGVVLVGDPDGWPIVWCHGGLSSRLDATLAEESARAVGALLVSVDRPGTGLTTHARDWSIMRWPPIVAQVMESLGHRRYSVAGWSAGGPYALACAWQLPGAVHATATIAGMYPVTDSARRRELGLFIDRVLLRMAKRWPRATGAAVARWQRRRCRRNRRWSGASPPGCFTSAPDRVIRRMTERSMTPSERTAFHARQEPIGFLREATRHGGRGVVADYAAVGGDWGFGLREIDAPVTVWHGDRDPLVPVAHAHRLADELPAAVLEVCEGAGHFLPMTHAQPILASLVP